jgi:thiol-disulfide isomerase/thioredoxin
MVKAIRTRLLVFLVLPLLLAASSVQAGSDNYTFVDVEGKPVHLADYKGKWVVVNYWATWCPPCREEIPELIHFHDTHKDVDAVVLGINMEKMDRESLRSFVDDNLMSYPVVPMTEDMPMIGSVPGLPTTYLLDPSGKPAAVQVGAITQEMIETFMAKYAPEH